MPQALCSRYGLQIGSYSAWFVRILIWASWIIAYPISKILDAALGTEHGVSLDPAADPGSGCRRFISSQLLSRRSRLGRSFGRACRPAASEASLRERCLQLGHIWPDKGRAPTGFSSCWPLSNTQQTCCAGSLPARPAEGSGGSAQQHRGTGGVPEHGGDQRHSWRPGPVWQAGRSVHDASGQGAACQVATMLSARLRRHLTSCCYLYPSLLRSVCCPVTCWTSPPCGPADGNNLWEQHYHGSKLGAGVHAAIKHQA